MQRNPSIWVCFFYLRRPSKWVHFQTTNTHIRAFYTEVAPLGHKHAHTLLGGGRIKELTQGDQSLRFHI